MAESHVRKVLQEQNVRKRATLSSHQSEKISKAFYSLNILVINSDHKMKKFGKLELSEELSKKGAERVKAASERAAKDPDFIARLEEDPESVLSELGFDGEGIRTFRLVDNVETRGGCECYCFPFVTGTGAGCAIKPGSISSSH